MLHVISARCVTRDLHSVAPGPLAGDSSRRSKKIVKNLKLRLSVRLSSSTLSLLLILLLLTQCPLLLFCVLVDEDLKYIQVPLNQSLCGLLKIT